MELENLLSGFNQAADLIHGNNKAKGFWDKERNVGELLMLVTSELGEAMEAHQKGKFTKKEDIDYFFGKVVIHGKIAHYLMKVILLLK